MSASPEKRSLSLAAENLGHTYGDRRLFHHFSHHFEPCTVNIVIGGNGSGKSTLLKRLAGLARLQSGRVLCDGLPIARSNSRERAQHIAYLPQRTPLYYDLPCLDVVLMGRAPHLDRFAQPGLEDRRIAIAALEEVGLAELAGHRQRGVLNLSGGERQRVMLARMLATQAPVWILDEPTTGLDIGHTLQFLHLLKTAAAAGRTVILALHELDLVRRFADHVICFMGDGEIQAGPAAEILTAPLLAKAFSVEVTEISQPGAAAVAEDVTLRFTLPVP